MDKLREFLKTLTPIEQITFANRCGTTIGYLRKRLCVRSASLGEKICTAIEQATKGQVTRKDLRPTDWHLIWPELIDKDLPPPPSS